MPHSHPAPGPDMLSEELWLLGQPPLSRYLSYIKRYVAEKDRNSRARAVTAWRKANDHYASLEESEAGFPDQKATPPTGTLAANARKAQRSTIFRQHYDSLKTRIALLELDRLVVSQPHVNHDHIGRIRERLGNSPSEQAVFECVTGKNASVPEVEIRKLGSSGYRFVSPSSDLRFLEAALLKPGQISGRALEDNLMACLGLMVGYSANHLSVIQFGDRFCLHNGHHKAYSLRSLGITHAPCIIQEATRFDEIAIVASSSLMEHAEFLFRAPRPPVLKDFFDPKICVKHQIRRQQQVIDISFRYEDYEIDA